MPEMLVLRNPLRNPRGWWEKRQRVATERGKLELAARHHAAALAGWEPYKNALNKSGGKQVAKRHMGRRNPGYELMEYNPVELELNPYDGAYLDNPRHRRRHRKNRRNPLEALNPLTSRTSKDFKHLLQGNSIKTVLSAAGGMVVTEKAAGTLNLQGWMKPLGSVGIAAVVGIGASQLDPQVGTAAALGGLVSAALQAVAESGLLPDWVQKGSLVIGHRGKIAPPLQIMPSVTSHAKTAVRA